VPGQCLVSDEKESSAQIFRRRGASIQASLGIDNGVNFANPKRAPLLLIAGKKNLTVTPSMMGAMYRLHKRSPAPVESIEFPNHGHYLIAEPRGEEVAGAILAWIEKPTR
jgi:pimeloyl-ACP methyl ester carboxylesterase